MAIIALEDQIFGTKFLNSIVRGMVDRALENYLFWVKPNLRSGISILK